MALFRPTEFADPARTQTAEVPSTSDLKPAEDPVLGNIPWGYGENRVTAMARDPQWIFVYWEVRDEALACARAAADSPDGSCALRVYDTTYRLFDGTNPNWFFDVAVNRPANSHYVRVDHPGSTFHVDIGVKGPEGRFVTIARSGPVETPRNAIASDTRVEWMTVTVDGPLPLEYRHRVASRRSGASAPPLEAPAGPEAERIMRSLAGEGWERTEWSEADMGGRIVRWVRWTGRLGRLTPAVEIVCEGERRVARFEHGECVTLGPWRMTIRALHPTGGSRVIDQWVIRYAWLTERGLARIETVPVIERILQGYRAGFVQEGSEARLMGESWASESLQVGASEWRWLGASEIRLAGASEVLYLGASEVLFAGASERVGASEILLGGASELPLSIASGSWP